MTTDMLVVLGGFVGAIGFALGLAFLAMRARPVVSVPAPALLLVMLSVACYPNAGEEARAPDSASPPPVVEAPRGDILLISVDTLRPDHMSIYGYQRPTTPRIQRSMGQGAVFLRAHSTESNTPASVASILSGLQPREHRIRLFYQLLDDAIPILPEYLAETHTTAAFVSNTVLTDEAMGMAPRFDHYDDFVNRRESTRKVYERSASDTTDAVLEWLDRPREDDRPIFVWVHFIDPHGPYVAPGAWTRSFEHRGQLALGPEQVPAYQQIEGQNDGLQYVDDYDEEIAYMDSEVGRLLDGFDQRRGRENALVLLTADHGETMMDHELWFTHGYHVYEALIHVPLLLRGPGVATGERAELVSTIDILPTLLDFAGTAIPTNLPGRSLLKDANDSSDRTIFAEATHGQTQWRTAIRGNQKWMMKLRVKNGKPIVVERRLYDLASDPSEANYSKWPTSQNATKRALLGEMRRDPDPAGQPQSFEKGVALASPKLAREPSQEAIEGLRALGYVE